MSLENKITSRVSRYFNGIKIIVEISDTENGYFFRMRDRSYKHTTDWSCYFEGILTLTVGDRMFAYATNYWDSVLPTNEPFEIVKGNR